MWITPLTQWIIRLATTAVAVMVAVTVSAQESGAAFDVVANFESPTRNGEMPAAPLLQASNGTFYGTTRSGGRFGFGTIFSITATGEFTLLHDFTGDDGASPVGPLVQGSDGSLYGTTLRGGASDFGTVFKIGLSGTLTTLHSFDGVEGKFPEAGVIQATDGRFYGTTTDFLSGVVNPSSPGGTIFRIDAAGTFTMLHRFTDGSRPHVELVQASDGNFYGVARIGQIIPIFSIFKMDLAGIVTRIRTFDLGQGITGPLREASAGYLYGMTHGNFPQTAHVFFKLDSAGTFSDITLSAFASLNGALIQANDGNFYGTRSGSCGAPIPEVRPCTLVFRMDESGTQTNLSEVEVGEPSVPTSLILATDGSFYATTTPLPIPGNTSKGTIFKWDAATGTTTLYVFGRDGAGANPSTGVIEGPDGRLYGTAPNGGAFAVGTVFAVDGLGAIQALHSFNIVEGRPHAGLLLASDGNFWGTAVPETDLSDLHGASTVFKMDSAGSFVTVPRPTVPTSGSFEALRGALLEGRDGNLYGTTAGGGNDRYGSITVVFPTGGGGRLYQFSEGGLEGSHPSAGLITDADGNFYGTTLTNGPGTQGTVFRITPAAVLTTLHAFSGPDGAMLVTPVSRGSDGNLYGTTSAGGASAGGTAFALDALSNLTTLHDFNGLDGRQPLAGLLQASDGNFYGTTCKGGPSYQPNVSDAFGTVFRVTATGAFTTLHSFSGSDGSCPSGELIQASDGHLYGTTQGGGQNGVGVLFRVRLATTAPIGYFEIVSRNSGKCLDVFGASTDAGAPAIQWTCHGGANQQWRLEPAGGGAFRIIARHSEQALDVYGALLDDVTPIIQWPVHGGDNQAWMLEPAGDGYLRIVARHSGKAVDVEFASTDDGARVIQYTPHGGANQQWLLRPVEPIAAPVTTVSER